MIRNSQFIKRSIGGKDVIIAVGEASKTFNGMIAVNATGAFIWDHLEKETTMEELVAAMVEHYDVDAATAEENAAAFVGTLRGVGAVVG